MTPIESIHKVYCDATGQQIRLAYDRERFWAVFIADGFTAEDVALVCRYLVKAIKAGDRNPGSIRFRNLIERPDLFEEELALAKAAQRNFKPEPTNRDRVIQAFRPVVSEAPTPDAAKPASGYVQSAIDQLRKAAG